MPDAYYNENDPFMVKVLRTLIDEGEIAYGVVDDRSVLDVRPADLEGFTQCHFFAGLGIWSLALRLAGWPDDRPVWTGSCPCQPFSGAGERRGFADERHLWPAWFHLIRVCRPVALLGEQVESEDGVAWLDLVHDDLEGEGYTVGASIVPVAGVGGPNGRHRIWFTAALADTRSPGGWRDGRAVPRAQAAGSGERGEPRRLADEPVADGEPRGLADAESLGQRGSALAGDERGAPPPSAASARGWTAGDPEPERRGGTGGMADPERKRRRAPRRDAAGADEAGARERDKPRAEPAPRGASGVLADPEGGEQRRLRERRARDGRRELPPRGHGADGGLADATGERCGEERPLGRGDGEGDRAEGRRAGLAAGEPYGVALGDAARLEGRLPARQGRSRKAPADARGRGGDGVALGNARVEGLSPRERAAAGFARWRGEGRAVEQSGGSFWADAEWVYCRDRGGCWRPVESGTFPLVARYSGRVGALRGYGNAISPWPAKEVIGAFMEWLDDLG